MKVYTKILATVFAGMCLLTVTQSTMAQDSDVEQWVEKARNAGIEQSVLDDFQSRVQHSNVDSRQVASIMRSAISMSENNLPAEAVIQKAMEGFSKGVPGGRILAVVDQMQKSMKQAAEMVDPWMNRPEVQQMMNQSGQPMSPKRFRDELTKATSKSIRNNISAQAVNETLTKLGDPSVLSKSNPADVVAAMGIWADLPASGNRPEEAGEVVVRALKSGFKADELQQLPSAMQVAQQRSQLPAASVLKGVAGRMRGNVPAKQILKDLFNGKVGGGPPGNVPKGLQNNNRGRGRGHSDGT